MRLASAVCAIICLAGCAGPVASRADDCRMVLDSVRGELASGEPCSARILWIPKGTLTRTRVSAEMLQKSASYRIVIDDIRGLELEEVLKRTLKNQSCSRRKEEADLRWGIVFSIDHGKRDVGMYFDESGKFGAVDSMSVEWSGQLGSVLRNKFGGCLK